MSHAPSPHPPHPHPDHQAPAEITISSDFHFQIYFSINCILYIFEKKNNKTLYWLIMLIPFNINKRVHHEFANLRNLWETPPPPSTIRPRWAPTLQHMFYIIFIFHSIKKMLLFALVRGYSSACLFALPIFPSSRLIPNINYAIFSEFCSHIFGTSFRLHNKFII